MRDISAIVLRSARQYPVNQRIPTPVICITDAGPVWWAHRRGDAAIVTRSHRPNKRPLSAWFDLYFDAVRNGFGDVAIESRKHGEIGERGALDHDRIDAIEHQSCRHDAARFHLVQHPRGGDAAFGGVQHQDAVLIALPGELVLRPREHTADAIEIVTRGETVARDQRPGAYFAAHSRGRVKDFAAHDRVLAISLPPAQAASTHCAIDNSTGR